MNTYLLARLRACQWRRGVLTGRWTEAEVERINRRAAEWTDRLRDVSKVTATSEVHQAPHPRNRP